jgi:cytochrome P450
VCPVAEASTPPPLFDPVSAEFQSDPDAVFRRIRDLDPVHRTEQGYWLVTRYRDVATVLRDPHFGRGRPADVRARIYGRGPMYAYASGRLSNYNPPDHTRLRGLMTKAFTASRVNSMRPYIGDLATRLLDDVGGAPVFDVIATLAHPLPSLVICQMLGVPESDRPRFAAWSAALARVLAPAFRPEWLAEADLAAGEFMTYVRDLAGKRRSAPSDDLLSALISAEEGGGRLSEDELVASVVFLFSAGHQTTRDLVGNGLVALLRHRDQLDRLRGAPDVLAEAVEESLRYDAPVTMSPAVCLQETTLGDRTIKPEEVLFCALASANRDPERFPDPDRYDIDRSDKAHLSFGAGFHFCLGAYLARTEAAIVFQTLLNRFPGLALDESEPIEWRDSPSFRGPVALSLRRT